MLVKKLCGLLLLGSAMSAAAAAAAQSHWTGEVLECASCHQAVVTKYRSTGHGKALEFGDGGKDLSCGACHGGELKRHVETGRTSFVTTKLLKDKPEAVAESCLTCHVTDKHMTMWRGSQHETSGISCLSCHGIHGQSSNKLMAKKTQVETCGTCHATEKNAALRRSTHLIRDERGTSRMECSACHNPHGAQSAKLISANSVNEKCYSCHQEKRGPFLWEHSPVRENCINCHTPHGSNNERLLSMRRPQLCQTCHAQQRHQVVLGRPNAMMNINRSCSNCHAMIHGSNHPSGVNFNQ